MEILHKELSDKILKSFFKVYNELGYGFLEKVFQNALYLELINSGLNCRKNQHIQVYYFGQKVGDYYADLLVDEIIYFGA